MFIFYVRHNNKACLHVWYSELLIKAYYPDSDLARSGKEQRNMVFFRAAIIAFYVVVGILAGIGIKFVPPRTKYN